MAVNIDISPAKYPKERRLEVYRDLLGRLRAQPGVVSAAEVGMTPISGSGWNESVRPDAFTGEPKNSFFNRYGPGYLKTMGTPLLAGRDFDARDTVGAPKVAVVNEAFAKRFFEGGESGGPHVPRGGRGRKAGPHLSDRRPGAEYQVLRAARGVHPDRILSDRAGRESGERYDAGGAHGRAGRRMHSTRSNRRSRR